MRSITGLFLSLVIIVSFSGCDYVKILHEDHTIIEAEEWLDEFEEITVEIPIELELVQTNEQFALITGPDYKVNNLSMNIEDRVLTIDSRSFLYERKDQVLKIQLPVKHLNRITLNIPTILSNKEVLNLDKFSLVVNGPGTYSESNLHLNCTSVYLGAFGKNSGNHILKGTADELTLRLEGLAWSNAEALISSKVTVIQRSLKSSYVHASEHLAVRMYSEGNVYYSGQPELDFQIVQPDWSADFGGAISLDN